MLPTLREKIAAAFSRPVARLYSQNAALLPALAAVQYRWLGTLSELEHQRMISSLHRSTERFCSDFDRDLTRIYYEFRSHLSDDRPGEEKLTEAYEEDLGAAAKKWAVPVFGLLQHVLRELPNPGELTEEEILLKIELEVGGEE